MNRILRRPMFRMGGTPNEGIMTGLKEPRLGYRTGKGPGLEDIIAGQRLEKDTIISEPYIRGQFDEFITDTQLGGVPEVDVDLGLQLAAPVSTRGKGILKLLEDRPDDAYKAFKKGEIGGRDFKSEQKEQMKIAKKAQLDDIDFGLNLNKDLSNETPQEKPKVKTKQDPEKALMDVYSENKGIIDKIMGDSDDATKRGLFLQLAKFGAGLASQPGGSLTAAIGRAAEKPLEGVGDLLAERRKTDREAKLMALSKTFDDMKDPEQIKFIKRVQKEYGLDSFKDAFDLVTKSKKTAAGRAKDTEFYRKYADIIGTSPEGFKRSMEDLDARGLGDYVGKFTRTDALLPENVKDRTPGEYYITEKGVPVRFMPDLDEPLQEPSDPGFTAKLET